MLIGDPKAEEYDRKKFDVLFSSFSSKWLQRFRFAELNSAQNENLFSLLFDRGKAAVIKVAPEKLIAFKDPQSEYDYLVFSDFSVSYHNNPTDLNGSDLYIKLQKDKGVIPITAVFDKNYKVGIDAAIMYLLKGSVISVKSTIETYCAKMAVIEKQIESYSKTAIVNVTFNQAIIRDQDLRKDIIENIRRNEPIIFTQAEGIQNNGEMIAKLHNRYNCLKNELNILLGWNAMAQQEKKEHFIQSELDSSIEEAEIFAKRYIDSLNCFAQHIEDIWDLKLTLIDSVEEVRNKMMLSNIKKQMAVTLSSQATINKNAKSSQFESISSGAGYTNGSSTNKNNGFRMKGIGRPNSSGSGTGSKNV